MKKYAVIDKNGKYETDDEGTILFDNIYDAEDFAEYNNREDKWRYKWCQGAPFVVVEYKEITKGDVKNEKRNIFSSW